MRTAALALLAFSIGIGSASAQEEPKSSPLPSHFPLGADACFGRTYDAGHLRKHPKQLVTSFYLHRAFAPDPNTETEPLSRKELIDADGEHGSVIVTAFVRLRDRKGVYSNIFSCSKDNAGQIRCGIDCDGGQFTARPSGTSLIVNNEGFVVVGGCGDDSDEKPVAVLPGADDKTFRLDKQPLQQCVAIRDEHRPSYAKLGSPLRERFAKDGTLCLSREYDAKHMASHPQQAVKRIAVIKVAAANAKHVPPQYNLIFRAELRNGQRLEGRTNCWPENYAYVCTHDAELDTQRNFYLTRAGDSVMLRDRNGSLGALFKDKLGNDDRMFRLNATPAANCEF